MKKSSKELEKELKEVKEELDWLYDKYLRVDWSKCVYRPLPPDIKEKYEVLKTRKRNLKININQMQMKEMNNGR